LLETLDIETGPAPDAAVIWLHGLGADAHDFEPIVPEILRPGERAWRFVFPNAPIRPVTLNGGMQMRAWYDLKSLDRTASEDVAGFWDTDARLRALVDRETARGIAPGRIVLGGFSQGGAASLYTALRLAQRIAGVLALSCYLPLVDRLPAERSAENRATPIFMAHGKADPVLSISLGLDSRDFLRKLGYAVEWHDYPIAHAVSTAEIADVRAFLLRVLP
jgi:phospholipase/carboxylesterase